MKKMKRVVFYISPDWAFGSIHSELCKYLFNQNIDAVLLSWSVNYSIEEMLETAAVTDVFVTNPSGYMVLTGSYGISADQIIMIPHAIHDIHELLEAKGAAEFDKPRHYAVVSDFLRDYSKQIGIERVPVVLPVAINVNRYVMPPAKELKTVGFAGIFHRVDKHVGTDIKRGYLVEQAARDAGLNFKIASVYHNSFVTMPGFYNSVDCVIIASTEEGAGLPALEAGAAGRLVIGTPVGHWNDRVGDAGGETVPIDEAEFLAKTTALLKFYKDNPAAFERKCIEIQKHATSYDWSYVIDAWKKVL